MLTLRADHAIGSHSLTRDDYRHSGDAAGGLDAFDAAWRAARRVVSRPGHMVPRPRIELGTPGFSDPCSTN